MLRAMHFVQISWTAQSLKQRVGPEGCAGEQGERKASAVALSALPIWAGQPSPPEAFPADTMNRREGTPRSLPGGWGSTL